MGLANLYRPPEDGWDDFWFNNWIDHQDIAQAITKQNNVSMTIYVIDPWSDASADGILERHQQYHNDMNSALGLAGQDLSDLNLEDETKVKAWQWIHYLEHQAAHQALGI